MKDKLELVRNFVWVVTLIPAIVFSVDYTKQWLLQAKIASIEIGEVDENMFQHLAVCSAEYVSDENLGNETLKKAYAYSMGNWINLKTQTVSALWDAPTNDTNLSKSPPESVVQEWKTAYETYGRDDEKILAELASIKIRDVGIPRDEGRLVKIQPLFKYPQLGCFSVKVSKYEPNDQTLTAEESTAKSLMCQRGFTWLVGTSTWMRKVLSGMYISFSNGPNLTFASLDSDFLRIPIPVMQASKHPGKGVRYEMRLTVDPRPFQYLSTTRDPCDTLKPHIRYPKDHAREMCGIECEDKAYAKFYNCSILNVVSNGFSALPPCNKWEPDGPKVLFDSRNRDLANKEEILQEKKRCMKEKKCMERKYCIEAAYSYYNLQVTPQVTTKVFPDYTPYTLFVSLKSTYTVVKEELLISTESWIGIVGGIIGVWVGLSIWGCLESCFGFAEKKMRSKSAVESTMT